MSSQLPHQNLDVSAELLEKREKLSQHFKPKIFTEGMDPTWADVDALHSKLQHIIGELSKKLVGCDEVVRLTLLAVVCRQHILLSGRPGAAKAAVPRLLREFIGDSASQYGDGYFEASFNPSTTGDDIFGPLSLGALKDGRFVRNVEAMLPSASLATLDEAFKVPQTSLLSSLLDVLNERIFKNGDEVLDKLPLQTAVLTSNEIPQSPGACALLDRMLFRVFCDYVDTKSEEHGTKSSLSKIMNSQLNPPHAPEPLLTFADLVLFRKHAKTNCPYPFNCENNDWTWERRREHHLVCFSKPEAAKLVNEGYLKDDGNCVTVAKEAYIPGEDDYDSSPDFELHILRPGWTLLGFKSISDIKEKLGLDSQNTSNMFPLVLTFQGESERVKPLDIVFEFVSFVRAIDERAVTGRMLVESSRLGDHRLMKVADVLRVVAVSNKRTKVIVPDLYMLVYSCWKSQADWEEISFFWLERLKQELRGMDPKDREEHSPEGHLWLPEKIRSELASAMQDGEGGASLSAAMRKQIITKARALSTTMRQR
eukprot:TRINITY_DN2677_c0_g2_i1.p1 TRINITY_DN2677_c0_g2~~TRINITY_DN2677_c0_g2_i1.p1  ORF type:complete len:538 (-),score=99.91 TRINITY_DN2677_c0_g2_i1:376-1989(-)